MGGKKKKVTIGYKYFMGLHMGICRGPIDALRQIRVGDKVAWTGKLSNNSSIFINQPKLFGGEEQEGGIEGVLDVMTGDKDQPRNARLSAMLGGLTSAFRGVATVFFDGLVCTMSPYPKEWSFLVQKTKAGWHGGECWYPEKCEIPFYEYEIDALQIEWKRTVNNPYKFNTPNDVASWMTAPESYEVMSSGDVISYPAGDIGDVGLFWAFISAPNGVKNAFSLNVQVLFDDSGKCIGSSGVIFDVGEGPPPVTGYPRSQGVLVHIPKSSPGWSAWLCFACVDGKDIETGLNLGSTSQHKARVYAVLPAGFEYLAMNPAHILRRLYTDPSIGRGLPASRLDEDSWRAAADKFYAEGFGLCMKWARTGSIADFAAEVINHAGAVVYTSRRTGKIVLKAIRDDYDINDLPLYTPDTGLLGFDDDEASAQTGGINEIVVNYKDPVAKADKAVREKNLGAIMAAGGITISESVDYPGIPTEALARRVARRDLQAKSGFIKRFSVRLDRRGRDIMPGGVFRISDASRGIENMVLRAGRVEYGTITDGTITVTALQDVFGLPATVYREPEENAYVPPDTSIRAPVLQAAMEAPYRDLVQAMSASDLEILAPDAGYLHAAAVRPTTLSQSFALQTRVAPAAYTPAADMATFCPGGKLSAALDYLDTTAVLTDAQALDELQPGTAALIGGEIVRVDAVNVATSTLTIARGCADTVPAQHAAGTAVLCYDSWGGDDQTEYTDGVTVDAILLTSTGAGQLSPSAATVQSVTFDSRAARPYPPGDVKLNGERYPQEITGDLEITWAHRDRLLQSDALIDTLQPSVGPEPGTTYAVELYDASDDTLLHSDAGITGATVVVPSSALAHDNRLELYSVRNGLQSWQRQGCRFLYGLQIQSVLPGAANLESYYAQLAVDGEQSVMWSVASGKLPKGLHLNPDTGVISGVVSDAVGYYSVTFCARGGHGQRAYKSYRIGVGNILCLLHFDGVNDSASITDAVSRTWTAYGNAKLSTTAPRLGSACLTLDGNGDYVKGQDTNWSIGTGEFDFSAFCRVRRAGRVFSKFSGMASAKRFGFDVGAESTINMAYQPNSGAGPVFPKSPAGNAGAWNFLSVHRTAGGKIGAGTNGEYVESDMGFDADLSFAGDVAVGMFANSISPWQLFFDGDVDELKLVAGARINVDGYIPSAPSDYPQPAPALAINGSLPPALAGQAYASTGDVQVHGSGAITVSVTDGLMPAGWSLSVSGMSVMVSGPGALAGSYDFVLTASDGVNAAKLPLHLVVN